jgi:hypothetical protein
MTSIRVLLAASLILFAGCGDRNGPVDARVDTRNALSQWRANAWTNYRFDFQRHCFCVPSAVEPVTIEVRGGSIVSVRSRLTGEELPRSESAPWYTIEDLFRLIQDAERSGTRPLIVRYHAAGYPTLIELGTLASDAGVRYTVENVVTLH